MRDRSKTHLLIVVSVALLLAFGLAACGGGSGDSGDATTSGEAGATSAATVAEETTASETAEPATEEAEAVVEVGKTGTADELIDISEVCGDEELTVALADGFGGNSWRRITRAAYEDEASKCANITKVLYSDANTDCQKAISDIQGFVAQGVDVIITFPDCAATLLPVVKEATEAGVSVVPYIASVEGDPGTDYVDYVGEDVFAEGQAYAEWMVEQLGGQGDVIFLGGTPGNTYSQTIYDGIADVFSKNPGMKLLNDKPIDTNWDPAETQRVVAGLLAKYPKIDGIISDYGGGSVGGIRAFQAAGRPLVPWAANDANEFACLWHDLKDANPDYQIATVSSRNWMSRVALRKAVAHAQGLADPEPSIITLPLYEDSTDPNLQPGCDPSLPPDAILSSGLSPEQLKELFAQ